MSTTPEQTHEQQIEAYKARLNKHDWYSAYSDSPAVRSSGHADRDGLRSLRRQLDADGKIWNCYAPEDFQMRSPA